MKKDFVYWLRWIAVLPGALISGFLATFPLHWVLYFTLANGETISGVNIDPIEFNLSPLVIAVTFILVGFEIAPQYKFQTSLTLSVLWIVFFIGIFLFMPQAQFQVRGALSLLGAFLGLYVSWYKSKHDSTTKPVEIK